MAELGDVVGTVEVARREKGEGSVAGWFRVRVPGGPCGGVQKRSGCARVNRGIGASRSIRAETSGAKRSITP